MPVYICIKCDDNDKPTGNHNAKHSISFTLSAVFFDALHGAVIPTAAVKHRSLARYYTAM